MNRETEAGAIFATHGLLDALTTAIAAVVLSPHAEANPVVGALLAESIGLAVMVMLAVVGAVALVWPVLADRYDFPRWFGVGLAAVGLLVALGNLGVVLRV